jgi:hypothetical protein
MKALVLLVLIGFGHMKAEAQIGVGIDFNPALLGCLMSGGACLTSTGIPIIDSFFGASPTPQHNDESFCFAYLSSWCEGPAGYLSAHDQCRQAKQQFYKKAKQQMGEWPTFHDNQINRESAHFNDLERRNRVDFTCTPRQKYLWLKNRCSHTQRYNHYLVQQKDYTAEVWARMKTIRCDD